MGLSSVLVDRARVFTNTTRMTTASPGHPSVPLRVEGQTVMDWAAGEWFACRINAPAAPESAHEGAVRADVKPTMIYELEDEAGQPVHLSFNSRVEVDSEALGRHMFEVEAEPTLYRKKEDLVAGEVTISRLVDDWPEGMPHRGYTGLSVASSGHETGGEVGTTAAIGITESGSEAVV